MRPLARGTRLPVKSLRPGKEMLLRVVAMLSKMTANAGHVKEEVSNDYDYEHEHDNGTR